MKLSLAASIASILPCLPASLVLILLSSPGSAMSPVDPVPALRDAVPDIYTPVLHGLDSAASSSDNELAGWDGRSVALASQQYSDVTHVSQRVFDALHIPDGGLHLGRLVVHGLERGRASSNVAVRMQIQSEPSADNPGAILLSTTGREDSGDLVFEFDEPHWIPAGSYWLTAWVERPFELGNQWYWLTSQVESTQAGRIQMLSAGGGMQAPSVPTANVIGFSLDPLITLGMESGEACVTSVDSSFRKMRITYGAPLGHYRQRACDPIPMTVSAFDEHFVYHRCTGCGAVQNRFEWRGRIEYSWSILSGGGRFALLTDWDQGTTYDIQSVLYVPPPMIVGQQITVVVKATARHIDSFLSPYVHDTVAATFTINITKEEVIDTYTVGGIAVSEQREELVYDATFDATSANGPPPTTITGELVCMPTRSASAGIALGGSIIPPTSSVFTSDYVVLLGDGIDWDNIDFDCVSTSCTLDSHVVNVEDEVQFSWQRTAGEFLTSYNGKSIVWRAPDVAGPVTITLQITDTGYRFPDLAYVTQTTINVVKSERNASFAAVAWVDDAQVPLPTDFDLPPAKPLDAPYYWLAPQMNTYFNPLYEWVFQYDTDEGWDLRKVTGSAAEHYAYIHPWYQAVLGFKLSANNPPPPSFTSLTALRTWMNNKDYRAVLGGKLKAVARRGNLIDFDRGSLDVIVDQGWTPYIDHIADIAAWLSDVGEYGGTPGHHSRGGLMPGSTSVHITGINTNTIAMSLECQVRIGNTGVNIAKWSTNRDAPWITGHVEFILLPNSPPSLQHIEVSRSPQFPSWTPYVGPAQMSGGLTFNPEPVLQFMNRGAKQDPRGI